MRERILDLQHVDGGWELGIRALSCQDSNVEAAVRNQGLEDMMADSGSASTKQNDVIEGHLRNNLKDDEQSKRPDISLSGSQNNGKPPWSSVGVFLYVAHSV